MKINCTMKTKMNELVEFLKQIGVLKTSTLFDAFLTNDRCDFVPLKYQGYSYENSPLSIGFGQTISQPYTVAFMLELLQPKLGYEVLDVGFGSGWTTGILAKAVGNQGSVFAVEIIPEVYTYGKGNLDKYNYHNIEFFQGSWEEIPKRKFDCILVSAAAEASVPKKLALKLKVGGRMVVPVKIGSRQVIRFVEKIRENELVEQNYPDFVFVPLV